MVEQAKGVQQPAPGRRPKEILAVCFLPWVSLRGLAPYRVWESLVCGSQDTPVGYWVWPLISRFCFSVGRLFCLRGLQTSTLVRVLVGAIILALASLNLAHLQTTDIVALPYIQFTDLG